tara:strand:- start:4483 stop:5367 length:885 start_codon:yes stop_codon:yes gene_type:complete
MPRLLSRKNLRYPTVDGQVLSSTSKGVQTWVDNKSVGISTLGATVGTANTIKFASGVDVSIVAGVASVSVDKASKTVTKYTATADQTTFAATYALGYVDVFLNGAKLAEDQYTASNGTSIVLDEGAAIDDIIEIVAFNFATGESSSNFSTKAGIATEAISAGIATFATSSGISTESVRAGLATEAISAGIATFATTAGVSTQVSGYLGVGVTGTNLNVTGVITATSFSGDGSNLSNVISGIDIENNGSFLGAGITAINFSTNVTATASGGIATITAASGGGSDGPDPVIMGMIF